MLPEPESYTMSSIHTHTPATFLLPGNNQLFNILFKLPDLSSSAHRPAVGYTDLCTNVDKKLIYICMSAFQLEICDKWVLVCLLVPLPAPAVSVYMPCVSLTLAGGCWGYSCDAAMCAGRYSTFSFGRH